jgi:hypothetical protein
MRRTSLDMNEAAAKLCNFLQKRTGVWRMFFEQCEPRERSARAAPVFVT